MTKQKRLEILKKIGARHKKMGENLVNVDKDHKEIEFNSKNHAEVEVVNATILSTVPVSSQEIKETISEELPAFFEEQRSRETESEFLTADEK
jgi:hypothetical protein